jgi:APA family basic amino acid/polyamine antiporter
MCAMGEDGVLPAVFAKRVQSNGVLFVSLSLYTAVCLLVVFWAKAFDEILSFSIFLDCFGMATSASTIFILRRKQVEPKDSDFYRMKMYPLMPLIFISAYVFVAISVSVSQPRIALTGLSVLAFFALIYFLGAWRKKKPKTLN